MAEYAGFSAREWARYDRRYNRKVTPPQDPDEWPTLLVATVRSRLAENLEHLAHELGGGASRVDVAHALLELAAAVRPGGANG